MTNRVIPTASESAVLRHARAQAQQAQALAAGFQQQAETMTALVRQLDAGRQLLEELRPRLGTRTHTRQHLDRLRAENYLLARNNSDLARRISGALNTAQQRGNFTLALICAALDSDSAAREELCEIAQRDQFAAYVLTLCAELDAQQSAVSEHLDAIAACAVAVEKSSPRGITHAPPQHSPRYLLAGSIDQNSPPLAPMCAGESHLEAVHSPHFPARKELPLPT